MPVGPWSRREWTIELDLVQSDFLTGYGSGVGPPAAIETVKIYLSARVLVREKRRANTVGSWVTGI